MCRNISPSFLSRAALALSTSIPKCLYPCAGSEGPQVSVPLAGWLAMNPRDGCPLQQELWCFSSVLFNQTSAFSLSPCSKTVQCCSVTFLLLSSNFFGFTLHVRQLCPSHLSSKHRAWKSTCFGNISAQRVPTCHHPPSPRAHGSPWVLHVISDNLSRATTRDALTLGFQPACIWWAPQLPKHWLEPQRSSAPRFC